MMEEAKMKRLITEIIQGGNQNLETLTLFLEKRRDDFFKIFNSLSFPSQSDFINAVLETFWPESYLLVSNFISWQNEITNEDTRYLLSNILEKKAKSRLSHLEELSSRLKEKREGVNTELQEIIKKLEEFIKIEEEIESLKKTHEEKKMEYLDKKPELEEKRILEEEIRKIEAELSELQNFCFDKKKEELKRLEGKIEEKRKEVSELSGRLDKEIEEKRKEVNETLMKLDKMVEEKRSAVNGESTNLDKELEKKRKEADKAKKELAKRLEGKQEELQRLNDAIKEFEDERKSWFNDSEFTEIKGEFKRLKERTKEIMGKIKKPDAVSRVLGRRNETRREIIP